ncbi:MAG TPA: S9 family peptidase, partial [Caldimonas sp.]
MATRAPCGSWASALSAERVAGASLKLGQIALAGDAICWSEGRPQEEGRNVLVRAGADGALLDLTPAPWNVRSRVHEYGGGAFTVGAEAVYFCHFDDQRLYRLDASGAVTALTAGAGMRYADATPDAARRRLV